MTDFLQEPGTSGFIVTPVNLMTTELNSLASGGAATSSVAGSSGVLNQTHIANAIYGSIWFTAGGSLTPTAGGFIAGWFLPSTDGGTTFEGLIATASTTVSRLPRAPDFTIPMYEGGGTATASGTIKMAQGRRILLPNESFKIVIQNLSGVSLPASGNIITCGPAAIKF